ncbi:MAG TPA: HutD family protein [Burkholderiaceae bacterium]|nr:HutD family protein [Burkholderiaceae bacterium]
MSVQVVELAHVAPTSWKNGGGTTRDLLAWPDAVHWQLRISVAAIESDGPFSDFSGVDRWFAVLRGVGVALRMGGERYEIRNGAPPLEFDGALAPMCWLLDGPTSDLNLLVRRDAGKGRLLDAAPGKDWVSPSAWRALVATDAVHLVIDDHVAAGTSGTALLWSAQAARQRWRMRPQHTTPVHGWWIEFRPHTGRAA